ncbi:ATPase/histidine kinase/DNA gyrase B/HSP90 domain protein [Lentilactobacillus parafarraginis F0439]|uniref:histidine kinase n=1 Tax=Lentilactobacillus parafarraginis F0439 TaxID=797515 RepID=G9ZP43_9LACO|nr:HAMP domain-containing sensor histidine kinase [Lentilactobacillus parafarraginis]EHL98454.1 ATPase/histidine kinase/DNA gyrase B/HSP90 domain protein [Lentilactobacillus parafarraginis F0439]
MQDTTKKQWLKFFINELVSFTALFAILGGIIYLSFRESIYKNINTGLYGQRTEILRSQKRAKVGGDNIHQYQSRSTPPPTNNATFRTNALVFNSHGQIENSGMIGQGAFAAFQGIKLVKRNLNQVKGLEITTSIGSRESNHYFMTLLIKVPKTSANPSYAGKYVLILQNIDADLLAVQSFKKSLATTLLIFWALAIAIAYMLSRMSMRPILVSWRKQKEFSANAAHELRTPITVIQNQMEYLLTKPKRQIMDEAVSISTALDEVNHMQTLIKRLLMLSRGDANIVQIQPKNVDLKSWTHKITNIYQPLAESRHKHLEIDTLDTGTASFDPDLMYQAVVILLDNALKYTPEDGLIKLATKRAYNKLIVSVSDSGPGIPDADKKQIFERFYRVDQSRNAKTGGNGLGLAIAKFIVQQHHGKIDVRDNLPHGTTFVISVPIGQGRRAATKK